MSSGEHVQRVLVIQDASVDHSVNAIIWAISGLSLQPRDKIKLLRFVQLFDTTCYRSKLHSSSTITQRQESIKKETDKKLDEDRNIDEMSNILQLTNMQQVEFERAVEAGHCLKEAIVVAAKSFRATSVILDRKSKKDSKYFMDNLTCAILKMKSDKRVVYIRRPEAAESDYIAAERGQNSSHLANRSRELTWERRIKIAKGIAKGLQYLHTRSFYGSMRPNNVLLTHDYDPLLANFGLARNQYEDLNQSSETRVLKTFEYLAPEYEDSGIDSSKTDVYSLGVVLLELITGRKTIEETKGKSFLRWARPLLKDKTYGELMDPVVLESHDLHQLFWMVVNTLLYISPDHDNVDLSLPESEIEPKNRMRETL
ncbi:hypothetical protein AgCh_008859 [Apium graveolens]